MKNTPILDTEIIDMFSTLVEEKDIYTSRHSKRVALYSKRIAEALALDEVIQNNIYQAGLLHDIGKILTPESVLLKPRRFNQREVKIIKKHSMDGERILNSISPFKAYSLIVRHHHERFDGKGYPDGLKGNSIPLLSRILSIADAFDAMTTHRVYKTKKNLKDAIKELIKCSGTQFDPDIIRVATEVLIKTYDEVHVSQYPEDTLQEDRFAYFFKDTLTSAYSCEYLNYFLLNNSTNHQFRICHFVQLHGMHEYNAKMGWCLGNDVLIEVALRLKFLFHSSFVFRIFGDDFVVLEHSPISFDKHDVIVKLCSGFQNINISFQTFDIVKEPIVKWESMEKYLKKADRF